MPSLAELTDYYPQPAEPLKAAAISIRPVAEETYRSEPRPEPTPELITRSAIDKLLGIGGERYQLWPEKVVREGLSAAGDVMREGTVNPGLRREDITDIPGSSQPGDNLIEKAQAISALAGTGGLAGVTDATLGATPFLRPALKYKDKLYKGKEGQQHMDVIPKELYPEFEKMAMSGEDISHYNFGFMNHKGQFLDREKALEYAINEGLLDPHAGQYGALTSTLMADSSKPGVAIEAMAKTGGADPIHFKSIDAAKFRLGQLQRDKAASKKTGEDVDSSDYMTYNTQIRALKEFINKPQYILKPVDHIPEF